MKKVVYRIDFPTGHFYIGSAKDFKSRAISHYSNYTCAEYAKEYYDSASDFIANAIKIIHQGDDYRYYEAVLVNQKINDEFCLNSNYINLDCFSKLSLINDIPMSDICSMLNISMSELCKIRRYSPDEVVKNTIKYDDYLEKATELVKAEQKRLKRNKDK